MSDLYRNQLTDDEMQRAGDLYPTAEMEARVASAINSGRVEGLGDALRSKMGGLGLTDVDEATADALVDSIVATRGGNPEVACRYRMSKVILDLLA